MMAGHRFTANPSVLPIATPVATTRVVTLVDIGASGCPSGPLAATSGTIVMAAHWPSVDTGSASTLLPPS